MSCKIYYPVPEWYRSTLTSNPKLQFAEDGTSAIVLGVSGIVIVFADPVRHGVTHIYQDNWTELTNQSFAQAALDYNKLIPFLRLDELLVYNLYLVGSDTENANFVEKFGLTTEYIRTIRVVVVGIEHEIHDEYGYYYIADDCSGVAIRPIIARLLACPKLTAIETMADLEHLLVVYVAAYYVTKKHLTQILGLRSTSSDWVCCNGYFIHTVDSSYAYHAKLIDYGLKPEAAETACELPPIRLSDIMQFNIAEELRALADRAYMLTYSQWKAVKQFIRRDIHSV